MAQEKQQVDPELEAWKCHRLTRQLKKEILRARVEAATRLLSSEDKESNIALRSTLQILEQVYEAAFGETPPAIIAEA